MIVMIMVVMITLIITITTNINIILRIECTFTSIILHEMQLKEWEEGTTKENGRSRE